MRSLRSSRSCSEAPGGFFHLSLSWGSRRRPLKPEGGERGEFLGGELARRVLVLDRNARATHPPLRRRRLDVLLSAASATGWGARRRHSAVLAGEGHSIWGQRC